MSPVRSHARAPGASPEDLGGATSNGMDALQGQQDERTALLRQIRDEVVGLKESPLYAERVSNGVYPVIGEGNHYAAIMFIGEAPGRNEALTGRPFVGAAGKILDELLVAVGRERKGFCITSNVKARPPLNRDPLPEEIVVYAPFLERQINIIKPKVIVTLGRFAMVHIMEKFGLQSELKPIGQMHGRTFQAPASYGSVTIAPMYHPAVAVYNNATKDTLKADFQLLKGFVGKS